MERLEDCIEELMKYTLQSYVNKPLNFELTLSPVFCSKLLLSDPADPNPAKPDIFNGVPSYPLYRHLALALYQSIVSGSICNRQGNLAFMHDQISAEQKQQWNKLVSDKGIELINIMSVVDLELHVQEPFFSHLKDGLKTIEGRCAVGEYNKIGPGTMILINKCLLLEVQDVRHYHTFFEMLETENLSQVLPGTKSTEEGMQIYRKFYTEEKERSNGVHAICVSNSVAQPAFLLASILSELSYNGVRSLLGLAYTVGTNPFAVSPPKSTLLSSFLLPYNPDVQGSTLTHGARALSKHADRSSDKFWGQLSGSDLYKNDLAVSVITRLITNCCWLNVYIVQPHGAVFEIRIAEGYGARWSEDGTKFIGFVEPYMDDGHLKGWKH